jgi:hypothetical protein
VEALGKSGKVLGERRSQMATQVQTKKVTVQAIRDAARTDLYPAAGDDFDPTYPTLRDLLGDDVVDMGIKFRDLRDRRTNPAGHFDSAGRWYPAHICPKCASVRSPSRAWPYSYLKHCRTADHVASVAGVDATMVKRVAKAIDQTL